MFSKLYLENEKKTVSLKQEALKIFCAGQSTNPKMFQWTEKIGIKTFESISGLYDISKLVLITFPMKKLNV